MQEITLPSGVTGIGDNAFSSCENLREINVTESNKIYRSINGVLYTKDLKTIIRYPVGKEDEKFVIPCSVTSIGDYAFWCCSNLREITLPSSVTNIGDLAFAGCGSLQEINIPPCVTSIGDYAFGGCKNLREITLPSNITSIGANVFLACGNLQRINIPIGTLERFKGLFPWEANKFHEV